MPAVDVDRGLRKRKLPTPTEKQAKKPRPAADAKTKPPQAQGSPLFEPHARILQELSPKYNVLPASVVSSTPIRKRLVHVTSHLMGNLLAAAAADDDRPGEKEGGAAHAQDGEKPRAVLLYARTAEVCKMITVAEKCKRLLEEQGHATWYQYNQLFDLPEEEDAARRAGKKKKKEMEGRSVVEETVLEGDEEGEDGESDSEGGAFETMPSRFEKAVLPPPPDRRTKSLRIFLSTTAIPELGAKDGVTMQSSGQ